MTYTDMLKHAAELPAQNYLEHLLADPSIEARNKRLGNTLTNNSVYSEGFDPWNSFQASLYNVPIATYNPKNKREVLLPSKDDAEGRELITEESDEELTKALDNAKKVQNPEAVRKAWDDYVAKLKQQREDQILAGSGLTGGVTAIGSYVGLGMLPMLRKHKILRAIAALGLGAGAGYAYHEIADPNIYRNVDWKKLKDTVNAELAERRKRDPKGADKAFAKELGIEYDGKKPLEIENVTPMSSIDAEEQKRRDAARAWVKRYGVDAGVGAAAGLGTYAATGFIPNWKQRKLLRTLLAAGVGVGAGAITDRFTRSAD